MITKMTNAEYLRSLRIAAAAAGLCYICRCRPRKPGRKTCQHCLDLAAERSRLHVASGGCHHCSKKAKPGRKHCASCLKAIAKESARRSARRFAVGLCKRCGKHPVMTRRKCCESCLDQQASATNASRKKKKAEVETRTCSECGETGHLASRHRRGIALFE